MAKRERPEDMTRREWQNYKKREKKKDTNLRIKPMFSVEAPPSPEISALEILDHKRLVFNRQFDYEQARKLIHVNIKIDGPFGIWHFGDLHLDDDGMDVNALERDMKVVLRTEAMLVGHPGDVTNNWIGSLAHLHGRQTTTARQSWILAEWFFNSLSDRLLYLCGGNHDSWSGDRDVLQWIAEQENVILEPYDIRFSLDCPNGKVITLNAKHTHKGSSMWNQAHGQMRFAQKGIRDNIIISGHRHTSGYGIVVDPLEGKLSHCIQVASYKIYDDFSRSHDMPAHRISPSVVTIINPDATSEAGLITVFHDTEMGADFLTWLRSKKEMK